jgi:hypothetical protein
LGPGYETFYNKRTTKKFILLADGWFKGHPFEIRKGGLGGVEGALADLKAGKASAVKYVFRVEYRVWKRKMENSEVAVKMTTLKRI